MTVSNIKQNTLKKILSIQSTKLSEDVTFVGEHVDACVSWHSVDRLVNHARRQGSGEETCAVWRPLLWQSCKISPQEGRTLLYTSRIKTKQLAWLTPLSVL